MLVAQSCPTVCNPMDCSPPGSCVHEIFQARILEWVAISFSRGSSQPRDQTRVSCSAGRFFTNWATREVHDGISTYINILGHSAVCVHLLCASTVQAWRIQTCTGSYFTVVWSGRYKQKKTCKQMNNKWQFRVLPSSQQKWVSLGDICNR